LLFSLSRIRNLSLGAQARFTLGCLGIFGAASRRAVPGKVRGDADGQQEERPQAELKPAAARFVIDLVHTSYRLDR
jgi:hypothetical protein